MRGFQRRSSWDASEDLILSMTGLEPVIQMPPYSRG
jgi:hypothetical protein